MTLDQLKILEKIVELGSIGAAAKALHRTQPTLSVAVRNLEEEMDLKIFSREPRRTVLTPIGRALYQKAQRILRHAESFELLGRHLAMGEESEVGIALDTGVPLTKVLSVLKKVEPLYPHTKINLFSENIYGSLERLTEDEANLAIVPWIDGALVLESIPFLKIKLYPVASPEFPPLVNTAIGEEMSAEELKDYIQVILTDSSRNPPKENYGVLEGGRQWKVNSHQTKKEILIAGMGWGGMPEHLIQDELDQGLLVPLKIERHPQMFEGEMRVVRLPEKIVGPVAQKLWELLQESSEL